MKQLLLLEEVTDSSGRLSDQLRQFRYDVSVVCEADLSEERLDEFDLAILNVVSRPMNVVESLRRIRRRSKMPILVLSGSGSLADCVVSLELGADDYLAQPANELELVARINALLRRAAERGSAPGAVPKVLEVGDIEMHIESRRVRRSGRPLDLTPVEFDLLKLLLHAAGTLVSRQRISHEVFGRRHTARNRAIDVHISNLRRKLGNPQSGGERIRTIRGYGYIYDNGQDSSLG